MDRWKDDVLTQLRRILDQRVMTETAELRIELEQLRALYTLQSNFIADACHQLRGPLASLQVQLYLFERTNLERRAEYLIEIKSQLKRLSDVSEDLLSLSRLEAANRSESFDGVNLRAVVEQVVSIYSPLANNAGLKLSVALAPDLPPARGYFNQLVQMVSNLVLNAINYTCVGCVVISTSFDVAKRQVSLAVRDTGFGIPSEDLPRLFDRFYRSQKVKSLQIPGTGLGLSIVREIVEQHAGVIEVESVLGEGSTFRVWLPLNEDNS